MHIGLDLASAAKRLVGPASEAIMGPYTRDLYEGRRGDINSGAQEPHSTNAGVARLGRSE